jgi:hypothetical protein
MLGTGHVPGKLRVCADRAELNAWSDRRALAAGSRAAADPSANNIECRIWVRFGNKCRRQVRNRSLG